jgi:hypothetical protein
MSPDARLPLITGDPGRCSARKSQTWICTD